MSTLAHGVASANELLGTFDCRVQGCTLEARSSRGPYAYLCDEHIEEKKKAAPASTSEAVANGSSYVGRLKGLIGHAKRVDQAYAQAARQRASVEPQIRKAKAAKDSADQIAAEFRQALRELAAE